MSTIKIQRVYTDEEAAAEKEGLRVYVDRLWPRGLSKAKFHYDVWAKDLAPSTELREWFHEDPEGRWEEFKKRYIAELDANPSAVNSLIFKMAYIPVITLLYGSKDTEHNNAVVLRDYLQPRLNAYAKPIVDPFRPRR